MKNLVFNVFGMENNKNEKCVANAISSCRGWSKIRLYKLNRMSSCRGWCKIRVYTA